MSRKTRKLIWSAPLVAVLAVAGALAIFMALVPNGAQAHDLPGPVTNLKAEGISHTEIKITWDAPTTGGAVTGYRIDVSTDQFMWEALVMNTGNTTREYTAGGLKADTPRYYRVFAVNAAGAGPSPVGESADNDLFVTGRTHAVVTPGQVRTLTATAISHEQIDLTWNEPASTGGQDIDRYCIKIGTTRALATGVDVAGTACDTASTPDGIKTLTDNLKLESPQGQLLIIKAEMPVGHTGDWPMFAHEDLTPELTLHYQAYAVNSMGLSGTATNVASATTKKTPKPGVPSGLKLVTAEINGVDLYWNWPTGQLDIGQEEFEIQQRSSVVTSWSTTPIPVGMPPANFWVQMNHMPTAVAVVTENDVTSTATWVEFQVRVKLADGTTGGWSRSARTTWPLPSRDGVGPLGLPGLEIPDNDGADADLSATATLNLIILSWTREQDVDGNNAPTEVKPTGFVIDAIKGTGGTEEGEKFAFLGLQTNTSYTTETYRHPGLNDGESWYYRAFPYRTGDSRYGVPLTLQTNTKMATAPDQLTCEQITAAADGPTKIALSWSLPSGTGGSPITGYLVQVSGDTNDDAVHSTSPMWMDVEDGLVLAPTRSYTYDPDGAPEDGLEAEDVRWFRVIVLNKINNQANGDIMRTTEDPTMIDVTVDLSAVCGNLSGETAAAGTPGQPQGLVTEPARDAGGIDPDNPVADSERGVLLLWNASSDPAGDAVTGYIIARRVKDDSASVWGDWDEEWAEIDESATSYTDEDKVANLDSGEARQYRIVAKSGAGTGASTPVVTYPHALAMHNGTTVTLGKPTMVAAVSNAAGEITLTWQGADNADRYVLIAVDRSSIGSDSIEYKTEVVPDGAARTGTITGLTRGANYLGIVVAVQGSGSDMMVLYAVAAPPSVDVQ